MKTNTQSSIWIRLRRAAKRFGFDWFIFALLGMILLAYVWPSPGVQKGIFSLSSLATYGVSLVFFFYGLKLNADQLHLGLSNWRMHLVIQLATFLLFPALVLGTMHIAGQQIQEGFWLGIFFLAALPSTVSSSVVMVSIARGNIPGAIFNASISSLLGVLLTPFWMGMVMQSSENNVDFGAVLIKLVMQVILPVILGLLLNKTLGKYVERHRSILKYFDQLVILTIVYTSFCESFAEKMFEGYGVADLLVLGVGLMILFALVYVILHGVSQSLSFNREDRVAVVFCGSKKSLVHGSVMAKVLFAGSTVGVVLLPVMIYHAMQLIIISIIAQAKARYAP